MVRHRRKYFSPNGVIIKEIAVIIFEWNGFHEKVFKLKTAFCYDHRPKQGFILNYFLGKNPKV